jgi:hypothetical protein
MRLLVGMTIVSGERALTTNSDAAQSRVSRLWTIQR